MAWNWLRRHPVLVDGFIVVVLGAVYIADAAYNGRYFLGLPLAVFQSAPLIVRRSRPIPVLVLVAAGALGTAFAFRTVIPLAPAVAAYSAAAPPSCVGDRSRPCGDGGRVDLELGRREPRVLR